MSPHVPPSHPPRSAPRAARARRSLTAFACAFLALALGLGSAGTAVAAGWGTGPATLQQIVASGGAVQASRENLTSPSTGVSRVHLDRGQMNGYKLRSSIDAREQITLSYQVRVPRATHDQGLAKVDLKMPGLAGIPVGKDPWYAPSGGTMRPDAFSVRLHTRASAHDRIGYPWWDAYVYAPCADGQTQTRWGISASLNGPDGRRLGIPVDRWFEVRIRVAVNTPGRDDGALDVWIDGVQGLALRDVQWRASGVRTPVNQLMAETFFNSPGSPLDGYVDYREFRVS
ncbi:hypothetical protein GCM10027586_15950 [Kineococcus gypseus]|uniref:polysaccharide lyase n=1 Tax=Kineococcus gypseus TaxID=1637102 RepID=UPI003D7CFC91